MVFFYEINNTSNQLVVILNKSNIYKMKKHKFSFCNAAYFLPIFLVLFACDNKSNNNQVGHEEDSTMVAFSLSKKDNADTDTIAGILDMVGQYNELSEFYKAASTIHLAEILEERGGQFTIFVPINAAFKAEGIRVDSGNAEQNHLLKDIVLQHIIPQHTVSEVWKDELAYTALNQGTLMITIKDSVAFVNGAKVIATDIEGPGGVLQVIDRVLLPKDEPAEEEYGQ